MSWSEEENPRGGEKGDIMDSKEKRNVFLRRPIWILYTFVPPDG